MLGEGCAFRIKLTILLPKDSRFCGLLVVLSDLHGKKNTSYNSTQHIFNIKGSQACADYKLQSTLQIVAARLSKPHTSRNAL